MKDIQNYDWRPLPSDDYLAVWKRLDQSGSPSEIVAQRSRHID